MKPVIILFLCLPMLFLSLVAPIPTHASISDAVTIAVAIIPNSTMHAPLSFTHTEYQPTAVTLARVQVAPAYPLFGIVGSLALIALVLMYRVYRSI